MLAPTRELVAELNHRARIHRLAGTPAGREVQLADGNRASVGDVIITRSNDRRLRLGASDWVKNGDRWTITHIGRRGDLTVRHTRSHLTARLPAHYVAESAELGYATTVHAAQGVTADTDARPGHRAGIPAAAVHHAHPRTVCQPSVPAGRRRRRPAHRHPTRDRAPRTPTEILEQILARDEAPTSATTQLRELSDPAARLHQAVQRYTDGLHVAAEHIIGPRIVEALDHQADQVVPGVTDEPAWPTLRADLIALAAETGQHPLVHLHQAALGRDLSTAGDMAAVLDWRLPEPAPTDDRAPLPWLRGIPNAIQDHPEWGGYLTQRSRLIADLAEDVRHHALSDGTQPAWTPPGRPLTPALIGEIEVWRAANGINPHDHRPTGPEQLQLLRSNGDTASSRASPKPPTTRPTSIPQDESCTHDRPRPPAGRSNAHPPLTGYPRPANAARPRPVGGRPAGGGRRTFARCAYQTAVTAEPGSEIDQGPGFASPAALRSVSSLRCGPVLARPEHSRWDQLKSCGWGSGDLVQSAAVLNYGATAAQNIRLRSDPPLVSTSTETGLWAFKTFEVLPTFGTRPGVDDDLGGRCS